MNKLVRRPKIQWAIYTFVDLRATYNSTSLVVTVDINKAETIFEYKEDMKRSVLVLEQAIVFYGNYRNRLSLQEAGDYL